jgi:hypothetical protein
MHPVALAAAASLLLGLAHAGARLAAVPAPRPAAPARLAPPRPDPRHSPEQVVMFQLAALRENDAADAGIATVFAFSSPANQAATGPFPRFVELVKSPAYRPLIGHRRAAPGPMRVRGRDASQEVSVTAADGEELSYVFSLTRQPAGAPFAECWMTDGVVLMPERDPPPRAVRRIAALVRDAGPA